MNESAGNLAVAIALAHFSEWLKVQPWFGLLSRTNEVWKNRLTVAVLALLTSLGIHVLGSWVADTAIAGKYTLTLTFTGLTSASIAEHVFDWFKQFMLAHGYWATAIRPYTKYLTASERSGA